MLDEKTRPAETPAMEHRPVASSPVVPILVKVHAIADPTQDSGVNYWEEWKIDLPGHQLQHGGINVPAGQVYDLHFQLDDESGRDLFFLGAGDDNGEDAMWVASGPVSAPPLCPTTAGNGGQIEYTTPCSASHLRVTDANEGGACILKYALRFGGNQFTGPTGREYPPYEHDPDIKNGGGSNS